MGCRNDSNINGLCVSLHVSTSKRADRAFLKNSQQLDLHFKRQFSNLVEKDSSSIGLLQYSDAVRVSSRERSFSMPE
jgi:hypothetical protein